MDQPARFLVWFQARVHRDRCKPYGRAVPSRPSGSRDGEWSCLQHYCLRPKRRQLTLPCSALSLTADDKDRGVSMSHHYSGPNFGFPHGDARLDLTDLYAFPKPGDADKSILIMNVHPSAVVNPPGPTTAQPFSPEALYEFRIDTDGDAVADITYRVRFSASKNGSQTATLRRVEGAQAPGTGDGGQIIVEAAPVSMDRNARVTD